MKKLSEILELAMPIYEELIKRRKVANERFGDFVHRGNMCVRIEGLVGNGITEKDFNFATASIHCKIEGNVFLSCYLRSKGRKTTALAQIRFYKQWIRELKTEGN